MIKYISTSTVPIHRPDNTQIAEEFATIHVIFNDEVVASPRIHVSELPEGLEPGDELKLVKA